MGMQLQERAPVLESKSNFFLKFSMAGNGLLTLPQQK